MIPFSYIDDLSEVFTIDAIKTYIKQQEIKGNANFILITNAEPIINALTPTKVTSFHTINDNNQLDYGNYNYNNNNVTTTSPIKQNSSGQMKKMDNNTYDESYSSTTHEIINENQTNNSPVKKAAIWLKSNIASDSKTVMDLACQYDDSCNDQLQKITHQTMSKKDIAQLLQLENQYGFFIGQLAECFIYDFLRNFINKKVKKQYFNEKNWVSSISSFHFPNKKLSDVSDSLGYDFHYNDTEGILSNNYYNYLIEVKGHLLSSAKEFNISDLEWTKAQTCSQGEMYVIIGVVVQPHPQILYCLINPYVLHQQNHLNIKPSKYTGFNFKFNQPTWNLIELLKLRDVQPKQEKKQLNENLNSNNNNVSKSIQSKKNQIKLSKKSNKKE